MLLVPFLIAQTIQVSFTNQLLNMMFEDATSSDEGGYGLELLMGVLRQKDSPNSGSMIRQAFLVILYRVPSVSFKRKLYAHPFGHRHEGSSEQVNLAYSSVIVIKISAFYFDKLRQQSLPA